MLPSWTLVPRMTPSKGALTFRYDHLLPELHPRPVAFDRLGGDVDVVLRHHARRGGRFLGGGQRWRDRTRASPRPRCAARPPRERSSAAASRPCLTREPRSTVIRSTGAAHPRVEDDVAVGDQFAGKAQGLREGLGGDGNGRRPTASPRGDGRRCLGGRLAAGGGEAEEQRGIATDMTISTASGSSEGGAVDARLCSTAKQEGKRPKNGEGRRGQPADHRTAERRRLLAAFAQAPAPSAPCRRSSRSWSSGSGRMRARAAVRSPRPTRSSRHSRRAARQR